MDWALVIVGLVLIPLLAAVWLTVDGELDPGIVDEPPTLDTRNHLDEETWTAP